MRPRLALQEGPPGRAARTTRLLSVGPVPFGFLVVLGAGAGIAVLTAITSITSVLVYAGVAYFLALVLEPFVLAVARRGASRGVAVVLIAIVLIAAVVAASAAAGPIIAQQTRRLATTITAAFQGLLE